MSNAATDCTGKSDVEIATLACEAYLAGDLEMVAWYTLARLQAANARFAATLEVDPQSNVSTKAG